MDEQHLSQLTPDALESGSDYAGVVLGDCELTLRALDGISLEDSLLSKVRAPAIRLANLRLNHVAIRGCDFANAVWEKARLTGLELSKCRLTGWNVAEGVLGRIQFLDCKINLAVLHGVTLTDCLFQRCDLREADFQGAKLKNVTFRRCDLRSARFPAASLKAVDFRGSHLAGIDLDANSLGGNVLDPSQLLDVAQVFGLVVRNLENEERSPPAR